MKQAYLKNSAAILTVLILLAGPAGQAADMLICAASGRRARRFSRPW